MGYSIEAESNGFILYNLITLNHCNKLKIKIHQKLFKSIKVTHFIVHSFIHS